VIFITPPVSEAAGRGMVSIIECWSKRFGRWAFPLWILAGLIGFCMMITMFNFFTPEMVDWPTDGADWTFIGFMLVLSLLAGPVMPFVAILLGLMFGFLKLVDPI
jgi:hypothetical protein